MQIFVGFTFSEYEKLTDSNKRLILIIKEIFDKKCSAWSRSLFGLRRGPESYAIKESLDI